MERDCLYEQRFRKLENRFQQFDPSQNLTSPSHIPTTNLGNTQAFKPLQPTQPTRPIHPPPLSTADVGCKLLAVPNGEVVAEGQVIVTSSFVVHGKPLGSY